MRATVTRCFCDKERSECFYGEGMEYEGGEARVRELTALGYLAPRTLEPVPAEPDPAPVAGEQPEEPVGPAADGPKPAPKAAPAKKSAQKKAAPKAAPKKVSQGGGLRDKI